MKARHKKAGGGEVEPQGKFVDNPTPSEVYAGEDSNVVKEAKKRKKGGPVCGDMSMKRADRKPRKSGGKLVSDGWEAAQSTSNPPGRNIVGD
jgi:hypothetical protein